MVETRGVTDGGRDTEIISASPIGDRVDAEAERDGLDAAVVHRVRTAVRLDTTRARTAAVRQVLGVRAESRPMTDRQTRQLVPGLYEVVWQDAGGTSLAAVGSDAFGRRWLAPTNWLTPSLPRPFGGAAAWRKVACVRLLAPLSAREGGRYR